MCFCLGPTSDTDDYERDHSAVELTCTCGGPAGHLEELRVYPRRSVIARQPAQQHAPSAHCSSRHCTTRHAYRTSFASNACHASAHPVHNLTCANSYVSCNLHTCEHSHALHAPAVSKFVRNAGPCSRISDYNAGS
eukprot:1002622-Pyramimonas_sp.AAC.1